MNLLEKLKANGIEAEYCVGCIRDDIDIFSQFGGVDRFLAIAEKYNLDLNTIFFKPTIEGGKRAHIHVCEKRVNELR